MSVATVAAPAVTDCRRCSEPIPTRARPGNTIRCPSCHYPQRYRPPGQAIPVQHPSAVPAAAWDPPSQPRKPYGPAGACPDCGAPLTASPRGTTRACLPCCQRVTPAGVLAPYERGETAARQVVSQAERDLEAISLAQRKGVMLAQLRQLAADDRLHPESVPVVEWFTSEVQAAKSQHRLDELAGLLPQAGIRRRRWWQGEPAAIGAPVYDDDDQDGGYEDAEDWDEDEDDPHAAGPAPAAPRDPAQAAALGACGWHLSPTIGGCQVIEAGHLCGAVTAHQISGPPHIQVAWVCSRHYRALCSAVISGRQAGTLVTTASAVLQPLATGGIR